MKRSHQFLSLQENLMLDLTIGGLKILLTAKAL